MIQSGQLLGGRYLVRERLGEGGWGAVHAAVQTDLGRQVAIKVLHLGAAIEAEGLVRFEREARAAAALGHPNIAQVTDFQARPGEPPFLVMELLSGETLGAAIGTAGRLPVSRVAWIAHQVLSALEAAHGAGIVHRDVKPDNVFLVSASGVEDLVKLLDFGIAKLAGDGVQQMTEAGAMMGSPAYMAPEQVTGAAVDARTDIYAVGATMYRALTGSFPFDAPSLHALMMAITTQPLRPVTSLEARVDPAFAAIVERALRKEPSARFASAAEMRAAIEPWTHASRRGGRAGTAMLAPVASSSPLAGTTGPVAAGAPMVAPAVYASAPPMAAPPMTAPPMTAPPMTAPPMTAPPMTAPPMTAPPMTAPQAVTAAPASSRVVFVVLGLIVAAAFGIVVLAVGALYLLRARSDSSSPAASLDAGEAPPAVISSTSASSAPVTAATAAGSRVGPGIARPAAPTPIAKGDAGGPVLPAPTAPSPSPSPSAPADGGAPSAKSYGGPRAEVGAGTYGGDADHDFVAPTRAAIAAEKSRIDACYAAAQFDPPEHTHLGWTIDVEPSGRARSVRPTTSSGRVPRLDACMIPILAGIRYPARPNREEVTLFFRARP